MSQDRQRLCLEGQMASRSRARPIRERACRASAHLRPRASSKSLTPGSGRRGVWRSRLVHFCSAISRGKGVPSPLVVFILEKVDLEAMDVVALRSRLCGRVHGGQANVPEEFRGWGAAECEVDVGSTCCRSRS